MAKYLVIVESPAKVKTIKKFLGKNYEVAASNGHVRDLPKSTMGIDMEHDYEPKYITIRGKGEKLAELRKLVKKADKVYLATDPDREGEAISWHLSTALKLDESKMKRITFNEITKNAVKDSLKNPREIDMNLVDAQQARRVLDRMVGYSIESKERTECRKGTVRCTAHDLRQGGTDQCLYSGRILDTGCHAQSKRRKKIARSQILWYGRGQKEHFRKKRTRSGHGRIKRCGLPGKRYKKQQQGKESPASIYDQYTTAGSIKGIKLFHTENDAYRTAAL